MKYFNWGYVQAMELCTSTCPGVSRSVLTGKQCATFASTSPPSNDDNPAFQQEKMRISNHTIWLKAVTLPHYQPLQTTWPPAIMS